MKIKVTNDSKKVVTLADKPIVDEIRKCCAEDSIDSYVSMALSLVGINAKVYETTAEIAKNCRAWNVYGTVDAYENAVGVNTEDFDVWIEIKAFSKYEGFYDIGVYLSDLWNLLADYSNAAEIRSHMYIEKYIKT